MLFLHTGGRMSDILQRLAGPAPTCTPLQGPSRYVNPMSITYTLDGIDWVVWTLWLGIWCFFAFFMGYACECVCEWNVCASTFPRTEHTLFIHYTHTQPINIMHTSGTPRRWDMVRAFPSVACVLLHTDLQALLLVRQFRPAVYMSTVLERQKQPREMTGDDDGGMPRTGKMTGDDGEMGTGEELALAAGFTYELCAGLIDKPGKSIEEIVQEEVAWLGWCAFLCAV